jgi:exodeoxyribonuclease VII large subunit
MSIPSADPQHNQLVYSVSELSTALKRSIEDQFGYVRVRGEISGLKVAASGHAYMALKDADALIDAVSWKATVSRLPFKMEDGLEVIGTGKLTTYPGRSKYQIILSQIEPAGAGALMAMLEARKAKLAAEGLFDPARKQPLPFLPKTIGIVTSPTGAVIRDILHRLRERWPVHVLLWPVLVQGEQAAGQIADAINGFNALPENGTVPRPDLLIVARGGGSIEDLWAFNEEIVVRAAAASSIPLISAVGHETDTTLIDYASSKRAPTPTAAAEMAVPVREEWRLSLMESATRLQGGIQRLCRQKGDQLRSAARALPKREQLFGMREQRLDELTTRLGLALPRMLQSKQQQLALAARGLSAEPLTREATRRRERVIELSQRTTTALRRHLQQEEKQLLQLHARLESLNPENILQRGYALVCDDAGKVIPRGAGLNTGTNVHLVFADTQKKATIA